MFSLLEGVVHGSGLSLYPQTKPRQVLTSREFATVNGAGAEEPLGPYQDDLRGRPRFQVLMRLTINLGPKV